MSLSQRDQAQTGETTLKMCELINIFINTFRKKRINSQHKG